MVTEAQKEALIKAACAAREQSYAPYSKYRVGAAILAGDGQIITGVNVENASFGLSICAERTAVVKGISEGIRDFMAIAICTENLGSPCGACRQTLAEFAGDIPVWLADTEGNVLETSLHELLPGHFSPGHLPSE
ncbi:MAG: cytidine deaminase [Candidatus Promineifilaceae bacterium]|nr:cytidine deaminase [Candidatus Promineifilaceae bacterium]